MRPGDERIEAVVEYLAALDGVALKADHSPEVRDAYRGRAEHICKILSPPPTYRTAPVLEAEPPVEPPRPWPDFTKWTDPVYLRFFESALGGVAHSWQGDGCPCPELYVVNRAERIADEAYRRYRVAVPCSPEPT